MATGVQRDDLWGSGLRDDDNLPLSFGRVYTYETGQSVTTKATYTDSGLTTQNTNPLILDSEGRVLTFATTGQYRFVIQNSSGTTLRTLDGLSFNPIDVFPTSFVSDGFYRSGDDLILNKGGNEVQRW